MSHYEQQSSLPLQYGSGIQGPYTFTDFRPQTGLFIPIYSINAAHTLNWSSTGSLTLTQATAFLAGQGNRLGVRSRFRIFPDAATRQVTLRIKFINISWVNDGAGMLAGIGMALSRFSSNTDDCYVGRIQNANMSADRWTIAQDGTINIAVHTGGVAGPLPEYSIKLVFRYKAGISGSDDLCLPAAAAGIGPLFSTNGILWNSFTGSLDANYTWSWAYGINSFLGIIGSTWNTFQATLTEFEVMEGQVFF